jgi:regulator of nonsense transcripts 2
VRLAEARVAAIEAQRVTRRDLRRDNAKASGADKNARPDRNFFKALDSTLKKNSAFVRKVRTLAPDNAEAMLLEASKLNLSRFLQELTPAVVESRLKRADILPTVQLCSLLHQRHAEFMTELMPMIFAAFAAVKGERAEQYVRQRSLLNLITECYVAQCVPDSESVAAVGAAYARPLVKLIGELIASDDQTNAADDAPVTAPQPFVLGLVVSFAQRADEAFLGVTKRADRAAPAPLVAEQSPATPGDDNDDAPTTPAADDDVTPPVTAMTRPTPTRRQCLASTRRPSPPTLYSQRRRAPLLRSRLEAYCAVVTKHAAAMYARASKQAFLDHQALNLRGELPEERRSASAMLRTYVDRLVADASALASVLGATMPELVSYKEEIVVAPQFEIDDLSRGDSYDVLWGDLDTRRFYEILPALRDVLPPALVGEGSGFIGENDDTAGGDGLDNAEPVFDDDDDDDNDDDGDDEEERGEGEGDDGAASSAAASTADEPDEPNRPLDGAVHNEQLLQVFDKLMSVGSRQQLDDAVTEFCYLQTKRSRARLVDFLYSVPWSRPDLVPYFARAAASLAQISRDVAPPLAALFEKQFYGQLHHKHSVKLETKLRTGRMLAEMCKFRIVAPMVMFRVLHRCLQDWSPQYVQVLCSVLESCGRFLFLMPHTHKRCAELLTVLLRKMQAKPHDSSLTAMLENAMYACKPPPDFKPGRERVRPPVEQAYVADLLYRRLSQASVRHALRIVRGMALNEADGRDVALKLLLAVHKVRYSSLELYATVIAGLARHAPAFVTTLVDTLVERIRTGLLQRDQRRHLRQTIEVRLLAELYNYELFQSDAIFNVLYYIILLGHSADPREINRLDPPSDWFRIRLVCAALDTCGIYFTRGTGGERLDRFLVYFERYLFIKVALPLEIEFVVSELFEKLRPDRKRIVSYEAAHAAVLAIEHREALAAATGTAAAAATDGDSDARARLRESEDDDVANGGAGSLRDSAAHVEPTDDGSDNEDDADDVVAPQVDEEALIEALGADENDDSDVEEVAAYEDTFERDFASLVGESHSSGTRRAHVDVSGMAIPMGLGHADGAAADSDARQMRFLQKKHGHQAVKSNLVARTIAVPADTSIARAAATNRSEELATKLAIRDFVLKRLSTVDDDDDRARVLKPRR